MSHGSESFCRAVLLHEAGAKVIFDKGGLIHIFFFFILWIIHDYLPSHFDTFNWIKEEKKKREMTEVTVFMLS